MAMMKPTGDAEGAELGGNVLTFGPRNREAPEPEFSADERREIRQMLRQFKRIRTACPTARREAGE